MKPKNLLLTGMLSLGLLGSGTPAYGTLTPLHSARKINHSGAGILPPDVVAQNNLAWIDPDTLAPDTLALYKRLAGNPLILPDFYVHIGSYDEPNFQMVPVNSTGKSVCFINETLNVWDAGYVTTHNLPANSEIDAALKAGILVPAEKKITDSAKGKKIVNEYKKIAKKMGLPYEPALYVDTRPSSDAPVINILLTCEGDVGATFNAGAMQLPTDQLLALLVNNLSLFKNMAAPPNKGYTAQTLAHRHNDAQWWRKEMLAADVTTAQYVSPRVLIGALEATIAAGKKAFFKENPDKTEADFLAVVARAQHDVPSVEERAKALKIPRKSSPVHSPKMR